jgi:fucose permease
MPEASLRIARIAHWAGVLLGAPMFVIGLFIFVSTAAIYLAMRCAGFLLGKAIEAFRNIGNGNGTSAGPRPPRPE